MDKKKLINSKKELEIMETLLDELINDEINQVEFSKKLGKTPQYTNRMLNMQFQYYLRNIVLSMSDEDMKKAYLMTELMSDKLIKALFGYGKSDLVGFPEYDIDNFWNVIKENLTDREYKIITTRFNYIDNTYLTLEETAKIFKVTKERIRQIENIAFRKLRKANVLNALFNKNIVKSIDSLMELRDSLCKDLVEIEKEIEGIKEELEVNIEIANNFKALYPELYEKLIEKKDAKITQNKLENTYIDALNISVRTYNALKRHGIDKISDFISLSKKDILSIRNLGVKSIREIMSEIEKLGITNENWEINANKLKECLKENS